jgi:cyclopropane fatty-acyl-phospholipid synthase-like methyltransferase
MKRDEFLAYKSTFVRATRSVLEGERSTVLDEAAFPAYAHPNAAISFLFWSRVRCVLQHLEEKPDWRASLDFGCGGGVMLPFLARKSARVVAMDTELSPLQKMQPHLHLPPHVELCDARRHRLEDFPAASFDIILALDVLEHLEDVESTLLQLRRVLAPSGQLIVSGPTENTLYRMGRRLAGDEYSGDYHVRDIHSIHEALKKDFHVSTLAVLLPLFPLFRLYCAQI